MKNLTVEYIAYDENDLAKNRAAMAKDVKGVECIYGGSFIESPIPDDIKAVLLNRLVDQETLGSTEVYDNNRVNIAIRTKNDSSISGYTIDGFLRIQL